MQDPCAGISCPISQVCVGGGCRPRLQLILTWTDINTDLDLHSIDPTGCELPVYYGEGTCTAANVVVQWAPGSQPPPSEMILYVNPVSGVYVVAVGGRSGNLPTSYNLVIIKNGILQEIPGSIDANTPILSSPFNNLHLRGNVYTFMY